ncbi:MAG: hypothetical protein ABI591_23205 [Kofleriaceae bacterium]
MRVPPWVTLAVAVLVIVFGLYRLRMSLKKVDPEATKKSVMGGGFYRMSPKAHLVIGLLYLALGGALIATTFGWSPLGGLTGKPDEPPAPHKHSVGIELSK